MAILESLHLAGENELEIMDRVPMAVLSYMFHTNEKLKRSFDLAS
jgi:hypothetical protein